MSRIRLSDVSKVFASRGATAVHALEHVSLEVDDGAFVVLLGPSGCGKTTMLRCIAGLEQPTIGRIEIGDRVVYASDEHIDVPPERRALGMVFQSYALWPHMTVADNVAYPLKRRRTARSAIAEKTRESLSLVGCERLADRYPRELSGGQQQRVSLARALVASPKVLLFDEPLSNLDAGLRDRMRTEIRAVQRRIGCTAVYVTHDQREAMAIADWLVVMDHGRVLQTGSPQEVYGHPRTSFVADFLGAANLIPVDRVLAADRVDTPLGPVAVVMNGAAPSVGGLRVVVRPESVVVLAPDDPAAGRNVVEMTLGADEFLGDHRVATFLAGDSVIRAKLAPTVSLRAGERYRLAFATDEALVVGHG